MSFKIGSLFDGSGGFPLAAFMCGGAVLLVALAVIGCCVAWRDNDE